MSHKPVGGAGGRAERAQEIGLFRYGLIRPVDPAAAAPRAPLTSPNVTVEPLTPAPDDKDWTWVLDIACPDCGFDAVAIRTTDVASRVRAAATAFAVVLQRPDARDRPQPGVWSVLEYSCHVRDVCGVFR